jgi:hypothetical protein
MRVRGWVWVEVRVEVEEGGLGSVGRGGRGGGRLLYLFH